MAITEQIELLGAGLYKSIPDTLTLCQLPTSSELDYVGSEDFDRVMFEKILPQAVQESIDFEELLEIDYHWILRCLRILNYGPFHTTNAIFCGDCGKISRGEYSVDLTSIECKPFPPGFKNSFTIDKSEFIDFNKTINFHLPTVRNMLNAQKDKAFQTPDGRYNREFARICYTVSAIGDQIGLTPIDVKLIIQRDMSSADYTILKSMVADMSDFGLRAGGKTKCPACGSTNASFMALVDDRFFRPTLGDLRKWKHSRSKGEA